MCITPLYCPSLEDKHCCQKWCNSIGRLQRALRCLLPSCLVKGRKAVRQAMPACWSFSAHCNVEAIMSGNRWSAWQWSGVCSPTLAGLCGLIFEWCLLCNCVFYLSFFFFALEKKRLCSLCRNIKLNFKFDLTPGNVCTTKSIYMLFREELKLV